MEDAQKHSPGGRAALLSGNQKLHLAQQSAHATPSPQLQGPMGLFPNVRENRDNKGDRAQIFRGHRLDRGTELRGNHTVEKAQHLT